METKQMSSAEGAKNQPVSDYVAQQTLHFSLECTQQQFVLRIKMEWLWHILLYLSLILIPLFCFYRYFICNTLTRVNEDAWKADQVSVSQTIKSCSSKLRCISWFKQNNRNLPVYSFFSFGEISLLARKFQNKEQRY